MTVEGYNSMTVEGYNSMTVEGYNFVKLSKIKTKIAKNIMVVFLLVVTMP